MATFETIRSVRSGLSVPAATSDIEKCVRLLIGGMKMQAGVDEEAVAEAFSMALEDAKGPVLKLAVKNLIQGKAPDRFSKTFLPSAPELSSYCRELEKYLSMLCDATAGLLCLPEASPPRSEMTEAERDARRQEVSQAAKNFSQNVVP